jgi:hypothetical protein
MNLYIFIKPLGIITYLCLLTTLSMGLFRWQFKYHKKMAIITLIFATIHALLVLKLYL